MSLETKLDIVNRLPDKERALGYMSDYLDKLHARDESAISEATAGRDVFEYMRYDNARFERYLVHREHLFGRSYMQLELFQKMVHGSVTPPMNPDQWFVDEHHRRAQHNKHHRLDHPHERFP